ncbi:hypothetical protein BD779DRAFT_1579500 [Infundibulicybe gibba]|nr:hypothetical protein BD779DRAFT_1579500 [Infundibulicybe gibba]
MQQSHVRTHMRLDGPQTISRTRTRQHAAPSIVPSYLIPSRAPPPPDIISHPRMNTERSN